MSRRSNSNMRFEMCVLAASVLAFAGATTIEVVGGGQGSGAVSAGGGWRCEGTAWDGRAPL